MASRGARWCFIHHDDSIAFSGSLPLFSLNAGWRPVYSALASTGIDNLLDRDCAESVSRAGGNDMGGTIRGYLQATRVKEPGHTLWLKVTEDF